MIRGNQVSTSQAAPSGPDNGWTEEEQAQLMIVAGSSGKAMDIEDTRPHACAELHSRVISCSQLFLVGSKRKNPLG